MKRFTPLALVLLLPATAFALQKPPTGAPSPPPDVFGDPWSPPTPGGGGGGGGTLPPLSATAPKIVSRGLDEVALTWTNSSTALQGLALQRASSQNGVFSTIRCWDPSTATVFAKGGFASTGDCVGANHPGAFQDGGLSADTMVCYRIQAWDGQGNTATSASTCAYTRGFGGKGSAATRPWQTQLMITTGTVSGAGTDDFVRIGLNDHLVAIAPHGNATWLDYPQDDFEAGADFVYDLNFDDLEDIHDITKISVFKDGNDPWCVSHMELVVDLNTVFVQDFSTLPGGCRWLGTNAGQDNLFEVTHDQLRASPDWQSFSDAAPTGGISNAELVSRVESYIGHIGYATELYWRDGDGASITAVDQDTLHVDVTATASVDNWWDPTVRLEFDVDAVVTCEPTDDGFDVTLELLVGGAEAYAEGWLSEVGEFLVCTLEWDWNCLEEELAAQAATQLPDFPSGSLHLGFCPHVVVDNDGNLLFQL